MRKKFSHGVALSIAAVMVFMLMIACSNGDGADVAYGRNSVGMIEIGRSSSSAMKAISTTVTYSSELEDLYWYYKATKKDDGYTSGQTNGFVAVAVDNETTTEDDEAKGLSGKSLNSGGFSYGLWEIELRGFSETTKNGEGFNADSANAEYTSKIENFLVKAYMNCATAVIEVGDNATTTIEFGDIWFSADNIKADSVFSLKVTDNGTTIINSENGTVSLVSGQTDKYEVRFSNLSYGMNSVSVGEHTMEFVLSQTLSGEDNTTIDAALYTLKFNVMKGTKTVISGDMIKNDQTGDITIEDQDVTVTFVSNGGSEVSSQTIKKGLCAVKPEDPTFGENTFSGWFLKGSSEEFDFSTAVNEDVTLYAHWEGLVETKSLKKTIDLTVGDTIEVAISPVSTSPTSVKIPANAISKGGSSSSELVITSYSIEVSPTTFTIVDQSSVNNLAVAGIDCTLKIDDEIISDFNKPVVVTTYIPKGLSSVQVVYKGDDGKSQPIAGGTAPNKKNVAEIYNSDIGETNLGYDKATGLLRFSTDHFSEFYVATNAEVCIVNDSDGTDISAMKLGEFRDNVNNNNDYKGYTVTVLKDCDYTNEEWIPIGLCIYGDPDFVHKTPFYGIFDGSNKTVRVKNSEITCCDYYGFFGMIYNKDVENTKRIYDLNLEVDFRASKKEMPYNVVGGLVSEIHGLVDIDNVHVKGTIVSNRVAGGLVGNVMYGLGFDKASITNCSVTADISALSMLTYGGDNWLAIGGIAGQNDAWSGLLIENCSYSGRITTDFTENTNKAQSYLGYVLAKGAAETGENSGKDETIINNFYVGEGSSIVGYQNVSTHYYPFEGRNMAIEKGQTGEYTYTGTPNHDKELLGGYFFKCTIDGKTTGGSGQQHYPHGGTQD